MQTENKITASQDRMMCNSIFEIPSTTHNYPKSSFQHLTHAITYFTTEY